MLIIRYLRKALIAIFSFSGLCSPMAAQSARHVDSLMVDMLSEPIGLDDARPVFSWKIRDASDAARQTAYRIRVSASANRTGSLVWDSGRVESAQSTAVPYNGTPLEASHRYFWTVESWDKDGRPYPMSKLASWETGLMNPAAWKGEWIGYERPEDKSVRESGAEWITNVPVTVAIPPGDSRHDFRLRFNVGRIARAELLTTGEDTAGAWVNGRLVLEQAKLPPWRQTPWKHYVRQDITRELHEGDNLIAIEVKRYAVPNVGPGGEVNGQSPMSACIYLEKTDGSAEVLISDTTHWKAMLNAPAGWEQPGLADQDWQNAVQYVPPGAQMGSADPGRPSPTGPVNLLRKEFKVDSRVIAARLYATALGAYVVHINGTRVGDQILSPGWTDYRQRVPYQTFDVTSLVHTL